MLTEMPKVGDELRYVGENYSFMTVGKAYKVTRVTEDAFFYVDDLDDELEDSPCEFSAWEVVSKSDMVDSPPHYTQGSVEVIDYIDQVADGYPGRQAVYAGNIIKYVSRAPFKNGVEDTKKALWYLQRLIDAMETEVSE